MIKAELSRSASAPVDFCRLDFDTTKLSEALQLRNPLSQPRERADLSVAACYSERFSFAADRTLVDLYA